MKYTLTVANNYYCRKCKRTINCSGYFAFLAHTVSCDGEFTD